MRRALLPVFLLALAVPVSADVHIHTKCSFGQGSSGTKGVRFRWEDGTVRDVSTATGTITVYRTAPRAGVGGVVLFTKTLTPSSTAGVMTFTFTSDDTARPDVYYTRISITQDGFADTVHGTCRIEGR